MNPADEKSPESLGGSPDEERIGELINEFFDLRERGEPVTEEAFLSRHPRYADELREHLKGLHLIEGLGSSVNRTLPRPEKMQFKGSSAEQPIESAPIPAPIIPGYEVLKPVGRGGMGLVYKAIQISTKRVVALKVLLEGPLASDNSRKRFEREIALAAQLRHANIIPIYDSGTAEGRMYYAMEYVFGLPLIDYVKSNASDIKARLQLFLRICAGVSHAHQRGVVHRDLKPSNILVDGNGEPHILDFGLAKAGGLGDMTTSVTAQIIGTPAYMSPEQAAGDPSGIDIRTDVYSLGVVLYEILTERMPYETNIGMGRVLHNIAHAEPLPPSRIQPKVDSELSAIVLKALEKSKDARYQSIDGLSEDVRRYLAGEPISAKPASGLYLVKKALLKHRAFVATTCLLLFLGVGSIWVVRQFTNINAEKAITHERLRVAEEKLTEKEAAVQQLQQQSQQNLDPNKAMEALISRLPADQQKVYEFAASLLRKPTPEAIAQGVQVLTKDLAEEPHDTSFKRPTLYDVQPQMSTKPPPESATVSELSATEAALIRILRSAMPKQSTSQPASQPAEPVASQPAEADTDADPDATP